MEVSNNRSSSVIVMDNKDIDIEKLLYGEKLTEEELTTRQWQIIEAAIKVFSEKGFEGSRTIDIAKEAKIAEGTIFRYFKTKKSLLIGLLIPLISKFLRPLVILSVEKVMKNDKKKPIDKVLEVILLDRLSLIKKNKGLIKTVAVESQYHPELLEPIRRDIAPRLIEVINDFVKCNIAAGNFKDLEPTFISRSLVSLLMGYIILKGFAPDIFTLGDDEEEIKNIVNLFLNGVRTNQNN